MEQIGKKAWNGLLDFLTSRKDIAIRFLYTILFLIVLELLIRIVQLVVLVQYVFLLISRKHNEPIRNFTNKLNTYIYKVSRYLNLNSNERPYPFTDFPVEMDAPEENVNFK